MKILLLYYVIMSVVLFIVMGWDKYCSIRNKRRVPEKFFFLLALLGGGVGGLVAMEYFKHKTKHKYFYAIFIATIILHIFVLFKSAYAMSPNN